MDKILDRCFEVFYFVCLAGWRALPLFAIVATLSCVIRKRVPARYLCWLWLMVVGRLLLPISITSGIAINSIADRPAQPLFAANNEAEAELRTNSFIFRKDSEEKLISPIHSRVATAQQSAAAEAIVTPSDADVSWYTRMERLLMHFCSAMIVCVPVIVICLPKCWQKELTTEQLEWVIRHEVAHVKGRDGLLLSIATVARSLHWFNPLSWIAASKLPDSIERAADELATRHLDDARIRAYGQLLLRFASDRPLRGQQPVIGLLAMAAPRGLRRRIESLGSPSHGRSWLRLMLAVPLIGTVAIAGLTDARPAKQPVKPPRRVPDIQAALADFDWQRPSPPSPLNKSSSNDEMQIVSIDVRKALRKARKLEPEIDAEKFLLSYFVFYPVNDERRTKPAIDDGVLTVELTSQQELLLRQALSAFEQMGLWQIVAEIKVIETNIELLDEFDWSASKSTARFTHLDRSHVFNDQTLWDKATRSLDSLDSPDSSLTENENFKIEQSVSIPIRATKIGPSQAEQFIHSVKKDPRSDMMQAPSVTLFNRGRAIVANIVQRPFVTDVIEMVGENATTLQPKISIFEDGWKCLLETTVTAENQIQLRMVFSHASVDEVKLASLPSGRNLSPDKRVTIQVPAVRSNAIAVESILEKSQTLLVFSPKPFDEIPGKSDAESGYGTGQVYMIHAQMTSADDILKDFVPKDEGMRRAIRTR